MRFDHKTYVRIRRQGHALGEKYLEDCGLKTVNKTTDSNKSFEEIRKQQEEAIKNENLIKVPEVVEQEVTTEDLPVEISENKEYTRDELKKMLNDNNINFYKSLSTENMLKLTIEHNLI